MDETNSKVPSAFVLPYIKAKSRQKVILNSRGTKFQVSLDSFLKFPRHTRLGKLAEFETLSVDEILQLCTDFEPDELEFFFERDPSVLNLVLNAFLTGDLHLGQANMCELQLTNELNYWMLDVDEGKRCCKTDFEVGRSEKLQEIKNEQEVIKLVETKKEFNVSWLPETRKKIWNAVEDPYSSNLAMVYFVVTNIILVLWTIYFLISSLPDFRSLMALYENGSTNATLPNSSIGMNAGDLHTMFLIVDLTIFTYFAAHYILILVVSPKKFDFIKQAVNLIDGISISMSLILQFLYIDLENYDIYYASRVFMSFKMFAFIRFFRLSWRLNTIGKTIIASSVELMLGLFYVMLSVLCLSTFIFYLEVKGNDQFQSIFDAFWWAIVTMTTVGYGDKYPTNAWSKTLGAITALWGVMLVALPVGVFGTNFSKIYTDEENKQRMKDNYIEKCKHLDEKELAKN